MGIWEKEQRESLSSGFFRVWVSAHVPHFEGSGLAVWGPHGGASVRRAPSRVKHRMAKGGRCVYGPVFFRGPRNVFFPEDPNK